MSKIKKGEGGVILTLVKNIVFSALVLLIISLVTAIISNATEDSTGKLVTASLIALLSSAAISGFLISKLPGNGNLGGAVLSVLMFVLIMMVIGVAVNAGKLSMSAVMNYICYFGVGSAGAFLGKKRTSHKRRKRR